MASHGLQGDLARQFGIEAGVKHLGADPEGTVFGQRAAGLAHEPHRSGGRTIAAIGANERRISRAAVNQGVAGWEVHVIKYGRTGWECRTLRDPRRPT